MATTALNTFITLGFPVEVRLNGDQIPPHPSAVASAMTQPIPGEQRGAELLNLLEQKGSDPLCFFVWSLDRMIR